MSNFRGLAMNLHGVAGLHLAGRIIGVPEGKTIVVRIEQGQVDPRISTLRRLAKALE